MAHNRLTVVQVIPSLIGGGAEQCVLMLAEAVAKCGHRSIVVSAGGGLVERLKVVGCEHIQLNIANKSLFSLAVIPGIRNLLRSHCVDIVHLHSRWPAWLFRLACALLETQQRPLIVSSVHGLYSVNRYSAVMMRSDVVIAVSQTVFEYVQRNYPDFAGRTLVRIDNGVDEKKFFNGYTPPASWQQRWFTQYPQFRNKALLLFPGRVNSRKGHEDFLRVLHRLCDRRVCVHGVIVGRAQRRQHQSRLKRQIARYRLEADVTWLAQHDDIVNMMAMSNILLSLSRQPEAFGLTVVEALHMGRPVIGYNHGGVGEVLNKCYPEGLVPVGDIDAVVERVITLLRTTAVVDRCVHYKATQYLQRSMLVYETRGLPDDRSVR